MKCCICGQETGKLFGRSIGENERICKNCCNKLPSEMKKKISEFDMEDIKSYMEKDTRRHPYIIKSFKRTARYGELVLDEHMGYIAFAKKLTDGGMLPDSCYDVFNLADVRDMSFAVLNPAWVKGGIHADVEIYISLHSPRLEFRRTIKSDDVCRITQTNSDGSCTYEAPEVLCMFETLINRAWERALNCRNLDDFFGAVDEREYALAKATLLVDDSYDMDEIKKQRNKLIKAFHPDTMYDDEDAAYYAQKINDAYGILKEKLRKENQ